MSEETNLPEENQAEDFLNEGAEPSLETEAAAPRRFSLFTKVTVSLLLVVGFSTAAVAYTAPSLLSPIAEALPDSLFPEPELAPCKASSC